MKKNTIYVLVIGFLISATCLSQTTTSDNFIFHYTNSALISQNFIDAMEKKFDNLDKTIREDWSNINLLNRSSKIEVHLYDTNESFPSSAPSDMRDWHVGYYSTSTNELHVKVPSTTRQLKYFPNLEKAAISIIARYVADKKRSSGLEDGRSFAFGLFESGYSPDVNLINTYLSNNSNSFPAGYSTFSTWTQLDDETNVQLAYTYMFASIFRYGYIAATIYGGVSYGYEADPGGIWYQIVRIFFLINLEDGGMRKFVDRDDFVIYSNSQEQADLSLEALQWYADKYDEYYGARINHPLLVAIYGSDETYRYAGEGNINKSYGGGEARGHECLRTSPATENLVTEKDRVFTKYSGIIGHEFMHNVFAYLAEIRPPSWLNEGSAMYGDVGYQEGYKGINVYNMAGKHNFFWNENHMYFPNLDKIFDMDGDFGYRMGTSAFTFIKNRFPKETLVRFMKRSNDFSIIGYTNRSDFQLHLYETLYHKYIPTFLFNPTWDLNRTYTAGSDYAFTWDGHYINDLVLEYSTDAMQSWIPITEVTLANGNYTWTVPNATNCILRFSDKKHPEINFTYQILGTKPTIGTVFKMTFENGAINNISSGNSGTGKDYVSYVPRSGNGNYAKFNGLWNGITVQNYPNLNFSDNWTIQGDFLIENTTGIMNTKPVLLEKIATDYWHKNYAISFNNNGAKKLRFEYKLENNTTVSLEVDAGITNNNWYTFYFARSVENNIVEARVYNQNGTLLGSDTRQLNGEGKVLTGNGGLYLGNSDFSVNERCLQGGLDNVLISDTYSAGLLLNTFADVPSVSDIPDQTINEGANFTTITLDNFVSDADNSDSEMTWTYSGNTDLSVTIGANRIATITTPNANWSGSENITFKATDPDGYSGDKTVKFTVTPYNLVLTSPNGGNFLTTGTTKPITWENTAVSAIKIEYSSNNGSNWTEIVNNISTSSMSYNWTVPNLVSNQCLIKISDVSNSSVFDVSESVFEIGVPNTTGGPYIADDNTILLMHFEGDLSNNSTLSDDGVPHGSGMSYGSNLLSNLGQTLSLEGSSYLTIPHNTNLNLSSDWTIELWFKPTEYNTILQYFVQKPGDTDSYLANYALQINPYWDNKLVGLFFNSTKRFYVSDSKPNLNQWYHISYFRDVANSSIKIVLRNENWEIVSTHSYTFSGTGVLLNSQDLRIGEGFIGDIDELRISNVIRDFEVLGVKENILNDKYKLYPNPAKNSLNIDLPQKVDLSIFTITGQKILEKNNIQKGRIDISRLKTGLYVVKLKGVNGTLSKKLIVE